MIGENIAILRRTAGLSQEALAEKLGVSRQTLAKWETGESVPDILRCDALAEIFDTTLEDLLHADMRENPKIPKGKYIFGTVTIGDKGQIVIPVKARRLFHLEPGDALVVLGDEEQGLALLKADFFLEMSRQLQEKMK
ncbi:MAG: helix-turn-helix domain-containing protein [Clostridia bacterium]